MLNLRVLSHGLVGRQDVVQVMSGADILVNIGNDSDTQLGSKVIEYMAMGKPILNVVSRVRDPSIGALADYPEKMTIFRSDGDPNDEMIKQLAEFVCNPNLVDRSVVDSVRSQFSESHISGVYASLVEQSTMVSGL